MIRLVLEAFYYLLRIERLMHNGGVSKLYRGVERTCPRLISSGLVISTSQICHAMDIASMLYFKKVLCLQRSSATTMHLRRYGHVAELVIGAQTTPFKAHAWVEINGAVVNDKAYTAEIYQELVRC
jgi:hypothetical protein